MQGDHRPRRGVQIPGPRVVSQPAPQGEHLVEISRGERPHIREAREEAPVIRNDRRNLRLMKHDFREPDTVGIARSLPRQVVAPVPDMPAHQPAGERSHLLRRPFSLSCTFSFTCSFSLSSCFWTCCFATSRNKAVTSGWNCGASSGPSIFTGRVLPLRSARSLPPCLVEEATNATLAR